jgi:hypothetical protein
MASVLTVFKYEVHLILSFDDGEKWQSRL